MATCSLDGCYRRCFERAGIVHDYCGRTHAKEAVDRGMLYDLAPPHGNCHRCQLHGCSRVVYFDQDTQTVHDFCTRRHAEMAAARGQWPRPDTRGNSQCQHLGCYNSVYRDHVTGEESLYCSRSHAAQAKADLSSDCNNPRCFRPAWVDASTRLPLGYCSSACAEAHGAHHLVGQDQCSLPGCVNNTLLDKHTGANLGYCADIHLHRAASRSLCAKTGPEVDRTFMAGTSANGFKLSVLTNQHPSYSSLKEQFFSKWQKEINGLRVERIFKVEVPKDVYQKHAEYEKSTTNTRRRFHGTSCSAECNFFVDLKGGPCARPDCSVCSICTHGFSKLRGNLGRTAKATNMNLRYGEGLYFSSVSGKANDYATQSEKARNDKKWRCMFTASVVVGRPYKTTEGFLPDDMCPPPGYNAVIGEVGANLNHDEVVVYNEDAAIPTYLIVYSTV